MKICSLLENCKQDTITYSYFHRGLKIPYRPDYICETEEAECYTFANGHLFSKSEVSWNGTSLLYDGIDICFQLQEQYFIDHINISFGEGSASESIEIFTIISDQYKKIGFYNPETGQFVTTSDVNIPVGFTCRNLIIRLNGCCKPIKINAIEILGAKEMDTAIWPIPAYADVQQHSFLLSSLTTIKAVGPSASFAAEYLQEMLFELYGYEIALSETDGQICIDCSDTDNTDDSYELTTKNGYCHICASGKRGLLYAVNTFLQLTDGRTVREATVKDSAFMNIRGIHLALPPRNKINFLKKLIKYILVPMHYNTVFLQISGAMRYDNYPEINEKWLECCEKYENGEWPKIHHYGFIGRDVLEKSEVRDLCNYMRAYGIEIIPEIQTWGHTQYITVAYPELAEKDVAKEDNANVDLNVQDMRPADFYPHTMCPLSDKYYDVIFGVTEEVLEVVQPERYVHMGHDEIYDIGMCPKCSQLSKETLFAQEVTTIHDYLLKKNLKMMIWADMLQTAGYSIPNAIKQIPKDIIMADFTWYFNLEVDTEDRLLSHDFEVVIGNLYSSHYPRFESRSKKKGILGGEVSTWKPCNESTYAYFGKIFDFVYTANMMWNNNYRSDMRLTYNEIIKSILSQMRICIGDLKSNHSQKHINLLDAAQGLPLDLHGMTNYQQAIAVGINEPEVTLQVNDFGDIISFVHATDKNGIKPLNKDSIKIGEYVICYEDQSEYTENLLYAENIYKYLAPYGDRITSVLFRHQGYVGTYLSLPICGKTTNGQDYTLGEYSFKNPYPDKKIQSIKIKHNMNTDANILVFNISLS